MKGAEQERIFGVGSPISLFLFYEVFGVGWGGGEGDGAMMRLFQITAQRLFRR